MYKNGLPTKQRILDEALTLFSVKGFEPVTVAEIADAVGIKAPSLYKHYKSKQDIFEAIIQQMDAWYEKQAASMGINGREAEKDSDLYVNISIDELVRIGTGLFLHFLHDEFTCKFRKMLTIEKYGNKELAAMYEARYIDDALLYQSKIFKSLSEAGTLIAENPQVMAMHYYSPVFLLLNMCECHPEREEEALKMLKQHIWQFCRLYGISKQPSEETE